jgi:hypothetical protein
LSKLKAGINKLDMVVTAGFGNWPMGATPPAVEVAAGWWDDRYAN